MVNIVVKRLHMTNEISKSVRIPCTLYSVHAEKAEEIRAERRVVVVLHTCGKTSCWNVSLLIHYHVLWHHFMRESDRGRVLDVSFSSL